VARRRGVVSDRYLPTRMDLVIDVPLHSFCLAHLFSHALKGDMETGRDLHRRRCDGVDRIPGWWVRFHFMMRSNTSLEPTADAVPIHMRLDSSIASCASLPRFTRLWLSLIR